MNFFTVRKRRKQLKNLLKHARTFRAAHEDVLPSIDLDDITDAINAAKAALKSGIEDAERANERLSSVLNRLDPPKPLAIIRDNFDVIVVAFSVAMAFRAYFYQPFKIPTGSMQPTLYGIHTETQKASDKTAFDVQPLRFFKWLVTGDTFHVVKSKTYGTVSFAPNPAKPGYLSVVVGGVRHDIPQDVLKRDPFSGIATLPNGIKHGDSVRPGTELWTGTVHSGDFVFVNRWIWNFRQPKRGEVMVFTTNKIPGLPQGTHYIKRMMGLPGESLRVAPPLLLVDGKPASGVGRVDDIAARKAPRPGAPAYAGFNPNNDNDHRFPQAMGNTNDVVVLSETQYYAMGDNSFNSYDSRYWGSVPKVNLLGPADFVYWPFTSPRAGKIR